MCVCVCVYVRGAKEKLQTEITHEDKERKKERKRKKRKKEKKKNTHDEVVVAEEVELDGDVVGNRDVEVVGVGLGANGVVVGPVGDVDAADVGDAGILLSCV